MKKLHFFRLAYSFLVCGLLLAGCEGPKGDSGDPGPQGAQGVQGNPGSPGATGAQGSVGTANVIQYKFAKATSIESTNVQYVIEELPSEVTLENSLIMVYVLPVNGLLSGDWAPLPSPLPPSFTHNTPGFYVFYPGSENIIVIEREDADGNPLPTPDLAAKIVIVPASIIKTGRYSAEFLNNYKAVQEEFNLPD